MIKLKNVRRKRSSSTSQSQAYKVKVFYLRLSLGSEAEADIKNFGWNISLGLFCSFIFCCCYNIMML